MINRQLRWLAVLGCVAALAAGCSTYPKSGSGSDSRTDQERERNNEPAGMNRGGGGGY